MLTVAPGGAPQSVSRSNNEAATELAPQTVGSQALQKAANFALLTIVAMLLSSLRCHEAPLRILGEACGLRDCGDAS